ncbi:acylneuraminate cytidylyltransferase [Campylobacter sp. faydin G-24]|uniref:Acylneuraminate cytidylyltransferase n=1 Tax=Campylobacter anatolicus TaxID=2829105 RepID=A0ABS5HHG4_9BACT|nr:acylneuraminate cytidylyltransferase [Campylobacter anatolicus]MBR8462163.1 acylneuraminate cytidylyltransferase [Campylobacter anatolicus]MBR8463720.1 acylneuraminate cytidylyltransferase [Campylobacter anatolicus]MBR8466368.1 acylneuraminate cytidylyltransferase [Campylobacter anatolicus]
MKNIAIILARQGSKGIPLKNLAKVGGLSLLARAIKAAKQSGIFYKVVVSTDGDEIAQEAIKFGAIVVKRPAELASDKASSISAMLHVIDELGLKDGIATLLQPTSPLRTATHIKQAYDIFLQNECKSVISVLVCKHHPFKSLIRVGDKLEAIREINMLEAPRQSLPVAYQPNGAIYINYIDDLIKHKRFFIEPIEIYDMDELSSVDIDSKDDLVYADKIIKELENEEQYNSSC